MNCRILLFNLSILLFQLRPNYAFFPNAVNLRISSPSLLSSIVSKSSPRKAITLQPEEESTKFESVIPTIEIAQHLFAKHERFWKNFRSKMESTTTLGYEMLVNEFDPAIGSLSIHTGTRHTNQEEEAKNYFGLEEINKFLKTWMVADDVISIEFHDPIYSSNSYIASFTTKWKNSQDLHGLQRGYVICHFVDRKITEYLVYLNTNDYMRYLFMKDYVEYSESNKLLNF